MRYLAYDPDQVVHLSTAVGATLVVGFGAKETVTAVAVTDSKDLKAMPKGNFLFFKSQEALPLQPVIVLTSTEGGEMRRYVFEITTVPAESLGVDAPGIYYSVQFTYPAEEAERQRALAAAQAAKDLAASQAREAQYQLQLAHRTDGAEGDGTPSRATGTGTTSPRAIVPCCRWKFSTTATAPCSASRATSASPPFSSSIPMARRPRRTTR